MQIQVLNVSVSTAMGKNNKPYQIADVAFKNLTFGGKVEGKKITSYSQPAFGIVSVAKSGDVFDIVVEKDKGGFNQWVSVVQAVPGQAPAPQQTSAASSGYATTPKATPAPRGNFETAEERAQRQVYIVRQSSISSAVSVLCAGAKAPPNVADVIATARKLEAYVFEQPKLGGETGFDDVPDLDASFNNEPQID